MLQSLAGRDLLLLMGSEVANSVIFDLTGSGRLWNAVWYGPGRVPRGPPEIEHPLGDIKTRISAAYFASFLWEILFDHRAADFPGRRSVLDDTGSLLRPLMNRWPQGDRLRFRDAFAWQQS